MKLTWDNIGEKFYKIGLSNGVLYPYSYYENDYAEGISWSGLSGIDPNNTGNEVTKLYSGDAIEDIVLTDEEYGGIIKCYTYPDVFESCLGNAEVRPGVYLSGQDRRRFGLSYRSLIGNDVDGSNAGFLIHIVYGCTVTASDISEATLDDSGTPGEFQFTFTSLPESATEYKKIAHIAISSLKTSPRIIELIQNTLYGTDETDPYLPLPDELLTLLTPTGEDDTNWDGYPNDALFPSDTTFPYGGS